MRNFGEWIARNRILILIVAIILTIPAAISALNMEVNYDILTYLPSDADSVKGQNIMDESFGSSDLGILVFEGTEDYVIEKFEKEIEALEGVSSVVWARDLVDITVPKEMLPDEILNAFYQDDSVMLMVNFKNSAADDLTQEAVVSIRELVSEDNGVIAGASSIIRDVIDLSDTEKNIYIGLAILLAIIILALTLPSTIIPILFLVGIGFGVIYNLGTNFFLPDVSYVTSAIAGVLQLGVTMDFSIFLYHRYEEEREKELDREKAMGAAIQKTAVSISGAALTTMAGFLALTAMELTLGANIGIVMAKGVFLGVICTLTIMPSLLLVFEKPIHRFNHPTVLPSFQKISKFVVKHHIILMILAALLLFPAIYGSQNAEVYYNLDKSLPSDMDSIVALNEMKETFDMNSTYFLAVDNELPSIQVNKMISEIEDLDGINQILAYQSYVGPMIPTEMIPEEVMSTFVSDEYTKLIINSGYGAASDEGNEQTEEIKAIIKKYDEGALLTGEVPMTKDLIDTTDHDIKVVNAISVLLLIIIIGIAFKSLTLPIILVMSIELAVFINMGIPYYTGTTVPFIASIVIGCIQLGTTVDYAILLTNRFKEELFNTSDKFEAMQVAIKSCSKSIVTSGLTFFGSTFAVALVSKIDIISSLALMMGRGALISMLVILLILPSLLLMFEKVISVTTHGWKKTKKPKTI
jgi:predicted RND superfamily exporter protein